MSTLNTRKDRDRRGKPLLHWRVQYATRPRRADERAQAHAVVTSVDPDNLLWLPNNRPLEYYW